MKHQPRRHVSNKYNTCTVVTSPVYIGSKMFGTSFYYSDEKVHLYTINFYCSQIIGYVPKCKCVFYKDMHKHSLT